MIYTLYKGQTLYQYSGAKARSSNGSGWNDWFFSEILEGIEIRVPDTYVLLVGVEI